MKPKDVLQPCPFCGGEAQVNTWTMHGITESRCFCSNSDCPNSVRTVALEQWNTRPIEDALNKRIIEVTKLYLQTKDAFNLATEILLKQDARIAELEAAQRWIPVSEPPKVSGKYLLLNIYDDVYPCDFIAGTEIWVLPDYDTITHWMPLPKLPEVQE